MLKNHTFARHENWLQYLNSLIGKSNITGVNDLRINWTTFGVLCVLLCANEKVKKDGFVTVEKQVCMFIHTLAYHVKNHTIGNK